MGQESFGWYPFERALVRLIQPARGPVLRAEVTAAQWRTVLELAEREQLTALASAAVRERAAAEVPPEIREAFTRAYAQAQRTVEQGYREFGELASHLRSRGILPVLMKGLALARFVYEDAALRPFSDIDLLVHSSEIDAADEVLRAAGYAVMGAPTSPADRTWRHGRGYYDPRGKRLSVDLHWRYAGFPHLLPLDYEGVFSRATQVVVDGGDALLPSPEDLVVALAVHMLRELWYGKPKLRYVRDLVEVTRRPIEWGDVVARTGEAAALRSPLALALVAAREVFDAPVPAAAIAALAPRRGRRLARRLRAVTVGNVMRRDAPASAVLQVVAMRWCDADSPIEAARWAAALLAPPPPLTSGRSRWLRRLREG